ncbi:general transcription factor IIH subunit 2 [Cimex lectularius]|uniref:General transcription factor IIH subunit n=1 Tax=Cimex lectularius TaxID=79782 RepID=A0A8I6TFJ6_CIMLE|nr:general transcription factor IIH subunit 2 [Cimex lectularius]
MATAEDDDVKEYRWETGYEKTWEAIKEDDKGNLEASVTDIIQRAKRKAQMERKGPCRLGMMRHMYIILDASDAMLDQDLKPTRQLCTLKLLENFTEEFLYESPLSQLGFILTRNKRAEKFSELSGNTKKHLENLKLHYSSPTACSGEPSLQNALELAISSLRNMPNHAIREVLIIMGSLTTCDPGDINVTIDTLRNTGIRVSVIGIGAEVRLRRHMCLMTGGTYSVMLDDVHFKHLLLQHVLPPPATPSASESALIKMGFPHHGVTNTKTTSIAMCMCHLDAEEGSKLEGGGYLCPQCRSKYCELPVECKVCGLTLVSAPHLARSYHHLFPVLPFSQITFKSLRRNEGFCFACLVQFKEIDKYIFRCDTCSRVFCIDCDMFVHDTLHTCPGCATNQKKFQQIDENS